MGYKLDLAGKKFGRLTALHEVEKAHYKPSLWLFRCACGNEKVIQGSAVYTGRTQSCGCLVRDIRSVQGTHNHCRRGAETPTWNTWVATIKRCKPTHKMRRYYFDKGITVCKRWEDFRNFLADMGERPPGKTLDRIRNDRGYYKENCRWSTRSEQQLNKSSTKLFSYAGESKPLTLWSRDPRCAVSYNTLHKRVVVRLFPFEQSLLTPVGKWRN